MSTVLDSKLRKALELKTDSPAMLDALDSMTGFWGSNTLEARRSLRHQLEHQNVLLAEDFITAFSPLQQRITRVETVVSNLEESCSSVTQRLHEAGTAMSQFTNRAQELNRRRGELEAQADEVALFLSRYSLSEAEVDALQNAPLNLVVDSLAMVAWRMRRRQPKARTSETLTTGAHHSAHNSAAANDEDDYQGDDGDDDDGGGGGVRVTNAGRFFLSLQRLKKVRKECHKLLSGSMQWHQSAAFELLEQLSAQQEKAYERVYHWVHDRASFMEACLAVANGGGRGGSGQGGGGVDDPNSSSSSSGDGSGLMTGTTTLEEEAAAAVGASGGDVEGVVEGLMNDPVLFVALQSLGASRKEFFNHCLESLAATRRFVGDN